LDKLIIQGGVPLNGEIFISGAKNAALPILCAGLLAEKPLKLNNVPNLRDITTTLQLLGHMGMQVSMGDHMEIELDAGNIHNPEAPYEMVKTMRASILVLGPLLARFGKARVSLPGGCAIGSRPVNLHIKGLQAMGAEIHIEHGYIEAQAGKLKGARIFMDLVTVTGTENLMMAAALAEGATVLENAAREPEVIDLAECLNKMGARIEGAGSDVITVHGVERLHGAQHRLAPDYIEIGSFIGLAGALGGELLIRDAAARNLRMTNLMFGRLGLEIETRGDDLFIPGGQRMRVRSDAHNAVPKIDDAPWPGFPADLMSIMLVAATQAEGEVLIHEKMFESRLFFVDKLIAMGAKIILCDPHRAVVIGPSDLHGEPMQSPDIRAGMALLIAALAARGASQIFNAEIIDRGYENIVPRLQSLGAQIERAHA